MGVAKSVERCTHSPARPRRLFPQGYTNTRDGPFPESALGVDIVPGDEPRTQSWSPHLTLNLNSTLDGSANIGLQCHTVRVCHGEP